MACFSTCRILLLLSSHRCNGISRIASQIALGFSFFLRPHLPFSLSRWGIVSSHRRVVIIRLRACPYSPTCSWMHMKFGSNGLYCPMRKLHSVTVTLTQFQHIWNILVPFITRNILLYHNHRRRCLLRVWSIRVHNWALWRDMWRSSNFGFWRRINEHLNGRACIWCCTSIDSVY